MYSKYYITCFVSSVQWQTLRKLCLKSFLESFSGRDDPIGVENLRGSGMIAGAMSKAYDQVVTLSLVSF